MDYEMPDGSIFSLREVWTQDVPTEFSYTSVTAIIEGKPYAAKVDRPADEVDHFEVAESLQSAPVENIYPPFNESFKRAPTFDPAIHYLKAPSFTWADTIPGNTFVADCVLQEVKVLELLSAKPHPNLVKYHGCVVSPENRITHICLEKVRWSILHYLDEVRPPSEEAKGIMKGLEDAVDHLHSLGHAHNDVNEHNVCVGEHGKAVLIDFDSCLPFGESIMKGVAAGELFVSAAENDYRGLEDIAFMLGLGNG